MIDLIKEIWQTMRTNKLRTFLTGFSVAWGIFMLIVLLALANGMVKMSKEQMMSNDPYRVTFWGGWATKPWKGLTEGRRVRFHSNNFKAIEQASPDIASVSAECNLSGTISYGANYLASTNSEGVYPSHFTQRYRLVAGRFINDADIAGTRKSLVICKKDAEVLFGNAQDAVGKLVKLGNYPFAVVGVYDHDWEGTPLVPFSTVIALNGYEGVAYTIDAHLNEVSSPEQSAAVESAVLNKLSDQEKFDPSDRGAVYTYDRYSSMIESEDGMKILNYVMWTIGILTLLTGIVGVSNIMFVSVRERTHEIGVRRAIGAKPRKILTQIIIESVALTTCFGYIGIVMGTFGAEMIAHAFEGTQYDMIKPEADIAIAVEVTVALIIAGAVAGLFPALRSLKINPVEALREE